MSYQFFLTAQTPKYQHGNQETTYQQHIQTKCVLQMSDLVTNQGAREEDHTSHMRCMPEKSYQYNQNG